MWPAMGRLSESIEGAVPGVWFEQPEGLWGQVWEHQCKLVKGQEVWDTELGRLALAFPPWETLLCPPPRTGIVDHQGFVPHKSCPQLFMVGGP